MTVFKEKDKPGFFVVCCQCGWHSLVTVWGGTAMMSGVTVFECGKCKQRVDVEDDHDTST
jgi:hypothetical protein